LSPEKRDFSFKVLDSHLQEIVIIDQLGVLVLVSLQMPLLVLGISPQSGNLTVPEVDLISILTSTLLQEVDLAL
jgi:hypothetical protein